VANLYYTDHSRRATAAQLDLATAANNQALNANIPRLTLLPGKKPNSFLLRNISNQPAYSILWAALPSDEKGHPVGYNAYEHESPGAE
jgi:hypothetical protein